MRDGLIDRLVVVVGRADFRREVVKAVDVGDDQAVDRASGAKSIAASDGIKNSDAEAALRAGVAVVRLREMRAEGIVFSHKRAEAMAGEIGAEDAQANLFAVESIFQE